MSAITWIKVATDMFEDEKLLIIESMPECDAVLVMWTKLLLRAGKSNVTGWIYLTEGRPYTDEMLAAIFRRPLNTVRLALQTLEKLGMIQVSDQGIFIEHFAEYQNIEGMDKIREQNRIRALRYRQSHNVTAPDNHVIVTQQNKIKNKKRIEKDKYEICPGVFLTAIEAESLLSKFGEAGANERIEAFSESKLAHGYRYKSDYHAILTWNRKDQKPKQLTVQRDPDGYVKGKYGKLVQR